MARAAKRGRPDHGGRGQRQPRSRRARGPVAARTPHHGRRGDALSTAGILEGVRAGRVYIDVAGAGRQLELDAVAGGVAAAMGGTLPAGAPVRLSARGAGAVGATVRPRGDGGELAHRVLAGEMATFDLPAAAARRWIAATVERDGAPLLIGNAIYLSGKLTRRVPARR
ncbi:hypothetical protein K7957_13980 [Sphingomonas yunnanensis]|uniref:hypothetical protein n=1 Tax=Sphingomonas yunnanensis TaxID=310400 RepID=UPI001CA6669F|nr:hypothetical protein [Sphingomonas yunnanensis]MBY9064047.1 hypothetical protein [Sphingomonas yunnanensis]